MKLLRLLLAGLWQKTIRLFHKPLKPRDGYQIWVFGKDVYVLNQKYDVRMTVYWHNSWRIGSRPVVGDLVVMECTQDTEPNRPTEIWDWFLVRETRPTPGFYSYGNVEAIASTDTPEFEPGRGIVEKSQVSRSPIDPNMGIEKAQ